VTPPLSDFLPGEEEQRLERYRRMSPAEKLECVMELNRAEDERQRAEIRARYGDISEEEMRMRLGALRYGREIMVKAFGWDPDVMGW
jgi:hypothetical protein